MEGSAKLRDSVAKFEEALSLPSAQSFPLLSPILNQIRQLAQRIDLSHLNLAPVRLLIEVSDKFYAAATLIGEVLAKSYPAQDNVLQGVERPRALAQNQININSWHGQLQNIHRELFQLISSIVTQQQVRVSQVAAASPIQIETSASISAGNKDPTIWHYMPLRNLLRCETGCGFWMASLQKLRAWSDRAGADIREGDVPPVVARLKEEFESARAQGPVEMEKFKKRYSFDVPLERLAQSFDFSFELQNTFVSSWSRKKTQSMSMWSLYGDGGKGVAIKSEVRKLLQCAWRIPFPLSGLNGPNRFCGLMLREVKYLDFDESDSVPSIDDLHLPLLKRSEFEDEREIRLVGFAEQPLASQGFSLICNLRDIIEEIVVGPSADLNSTIAEIAENAPDLLGLPVTQSTLSPAAAR